MTLAFFSFNLRGVSVDGAKELPLRNTCITVETEAKTNQRVSFLRKNAFSVYGILVPDRCFGRWALLRKNASLQKNYFKSSAASILHDT